MRSLVAVIALLAASVAQAQVQPASPRAAERRVVIDMDADVIEGARLIPPAHVAAGAPDYKHKSLIQLRKDFRREVLASGSHF